MVKYIAFVCGHNHGRSQISQAAFNFLKMLSPKVDKGYEGISWGHKVAKDIPPRVIKAMKEIGIDMSDKEFCRGGPCVRPLNKVFKSERKET